MKQYSRFKKSFIQSQSLTTLFSQLLILELLVLSIKLMIAKLKIYIYTSGAVSYIDRNLPFLDQLQR